MKGSNKYALIHLDLPCCINLYYEIVPTGGFMDHEYYLRAYETYFEGIQKLSNETG